MKRQWVVLVALTVLVMVAFPSQAEVFLWPQPRSVVWGCGPPIPLAAAFQFRVPQAIPELQRAALRFRNLIFREQWVPVPASDERKPCDGNGIFGAEVKELAYVTVKVLDGGAADLQHGVDESYRIEVPDGGGEEAVVEAETIWGALHGLETFSQLVKWEEGKAAIREKAGGSGRMVVEHGVKVTDTPLYPYRGVLLDTGRNFYPLRDILRTLRALAHNKLNVLHWHITDSQSFPIELPSEPELSRKGSYGSQFVYSQHDVRRIVAYARSLGVRIVPEIDVPGHTASWGGAYPDIITCRNDYWYNPGGATFANEPTPGQLNPLNPKTYSVVRNVIHDVASAFPDDLFHGGVDEIKPDCWSASPDIRSYLQKGGTIQNLLQDFVAAIHPFITSQNKTVIYWEDVLLGIEVSVSSAILPPPSTILETWNNGPLNTKRLTSAGYRTIVASSDFYYLDCGRGDFVGNDSRVDVPIDPNPGSPSYNYLGSGGSWCAPYKSWQRIYDYDIDFNLTNDEAALLLGGEVALWSEQADGNVVDGLLWPRASALAESLWSGNRASDGQRRSVEALNRLNDWRYRMVERGIAATPLQPLWCIKNPGQCNYI